MLETRNLIDEGKLFSNRVSSFEHPAFISQQRKDTPESSILHWNYFISDRV
jgi:hypothetical protein